MAGSQPPFKWVSCSHGKVAPNAVGGGWDIDNETLYVARAQHKEHVIPGKVYPPFRLCYVPYGGKEWLYSEYQVLVPADGFQTTWEKGSYGNVPPGAIKAAVTPDGEPLYIGRRLHHHNDYQSTLVLGKVHPSHGVCYVSFDGKEHAYTDYEVLCGNYATS